MTDETGSPGDLSPTELRAFAAGYLEALRDRKAEWDRLVTALETTERALAVERRAADIYYHDAYCSCRKRSARAFTSSAEAVAYRTHHDGVSGP
jgi:hypothetical protein